MDRFSLDIRRTLVFKPSVFVGMQNTPVSTSVLYFPVPNTHFFFDSMLLSTNFYATD
jgi:hypothetical protein